MNWSLETTDQCDRDLKKYAKKAPATYLAVMENLQKYHLSLGAATHPRLVQFGFLHEEPKGIRAIDQSGGLLANGKKRGKLEQTRLYTYADLESNVLHLLCMGSKNTQPKDIKFAESAVTHLRSSSGDHS